MQPGRSVLWPHQAFELQAAAREPGGEACVSLPELSLFIMSALPEANAERKQKPIRQVWSRRLDMRRLLNPGLEPEGLRLEQEGVARSSASQ